jgi:hypothetical protein
MRLVRAVVTLRSDLRRRGSYLGARVLEPAGPAVTVPGMAGSSGWRPALPLQGQVSRHPIPEHHPQDGTGA